MKLFKQLPSPYFDEPDNSSGGTTEELTKADIEELLKDDTDDDSSVPVDKRDKDEKLELEKKEEDAESDEIVIKDVDDDEEPDQELVLPISKKKILAKYPNLFKDFPYLEKAYYADQHYKEIFPTLEDAKEANAKADALDKYEAKLFSGSLTELLTAIKNADENAFLKLVDNYFSDLAKTDKRAFDHVLGRVTKQTIVAMVEEARASSNEKLQEAALILNQFAFGKSTFEPPTKLSKEEAPDNKAQQDFVRERFQVTSEDLNTRIHNSLKATISDYIDPKNAMTDYVKKNAIKDALSLVDQVIAADKQFTTIKDSLWKKAFENNFNRDSVSKIRSAYLSKAKTILPAVIKKARNDALRGQSKRTDDDREEKRGLVPRGKPATTSTTKSNEIPRGMSTLEFLSKD